MMDIVKEEVDPGRGSSQASAQSPSDVGVSPSALQSSPGSIHLPSSSDNLCEYQTSSSVKWVPCPPLIDSLASSGTQLVTANALGQTTNGASLNLQNPEFNKEREDNSQEEIIPSFPVKRSGKISSEAEKQRRHDNFRRPIASH